LEAIGAGKARAVATRLDGITNLSFVQETVSAEHAGTAGRDDEGGTAVGAVDAVGVGVADFQAVVDLSVSAEATASQAVVGGDEGSAATGAVHGAGGILGGTRIAHLSGIEVAVSAAGASSVAAHVDGDVAFVAAGGTVVHASGQGRIAGLAIIKDSVTTLGTVTITDGDVAIAASGTVGGARGLVEGDITDLADVNEAVSALAASSLGVADGEPHIFGGVAGSASGTIGKTVLIGSGITKFSGLDVQNSVSAESTASLSETAGKFFLVQNHTLLATSHTVHSAVGVFGVVANFAGADVIDNSVTAISATKRGDGDGPLGASAVEVASGVGGVALLACVQLAIAALDEGGQERFGDGGGGIAAGDGEEFEFGDRSSDEGASEILEGVSGDGLGGTSDNNEGPLKGRWYVNALSLPCTRIDVGGFVGVGLNPHTDFLSGVSQTNDHEHLARVRAELVGTQEVEIKEVAAGVTELQPPTAVVVIVVGEIGPVPI
jgi:hypothetical protein